jgi:DNA modification methylase
VDALVTDPPYGIGYESGHATDRLWAAGRKITNDEDVSVRNAVLGMFDCATLAFGSRKAPLPPRCRQVLIWNKLGALGMGALDLPWKPGHEEIYVLGSGFVGGRQWHSVITHAPIQAMACNGRTHPNEKPVGLMMMLLKWCPAGTILDPFMGSGTTGVAAVKLGRKFVGIEIEPKYFDIAVRRIAEALKQPDLFIERLKPAKQETLDLSFAERWPR